MINNENYYVGLSSNALVADYLVLLNIGRDILINQYTAGE